MQSDIIFRKLRRDQLMKLKASSPDQLLKEEAISELQRRDEISKFWRSFLFPNLWAVLSFVLAVSSILRKS